MALRQGDWRIQVLGTLPCLHQGCDGIIEVDSKDFEKRVRCPKCKAPFTAKCDVWLEDDSHPTIRSG